MGRRLYIVALLLVCFSYPITTVTMLALGADVSAFNVAMKIAIAGMFLFSLLFAFSTKSRRNFVAVPLILFFLVYSARVLYDVLVLGILLPLQSQTYVFGYLFGLTVLPIIVCYLAIEKSDLRLIHKGTFLLLGIANVALLLHVFLGGDVTLNTAFSGRMQVDGELEGTALLNPITIGLTGAMLAVFAAGRVAVLRKMSAGSQIAHLSLIGLGMANMLLGASRGPALAFVLAFLALIFAASSWRDRVKLQLRSWLYFIAILVVVIAVVQVQDVDIQLVDRFRMMIDERMTGGTEERDFIYALAWSDFLANPWFGSSYIVTRGSYMPHNVFLESLMATGLFGSALMFAAVLYLSWGTWQLVRGVAGPEGVSIGLVTICLLVLSLSSGSIPGNPEFWTYLTCAGILGYKFKRAAERPVKAPAKTAIGNAPFRKRHIDDRIVHRHT